MADDNVQSENYDDNNNSEVLLMPNDNNNSSSVIDLVTDTTQSMENIHTSSQLFAKTFLGAEFQTVIKPEKIENNNNTEEAENSASPLEIEVRIVEEEVTVKSLTAITEVTEENTNQFFIKQTSQENVPSLSEDTQIHYEESSSDESDIDDNQFIAPVPLGFTDSRNPTIERNLDRPAISEIINKFENNAPSDHSKTSEITVEEEINVENVIEPEIENVSENDDQESIGPPSYVPITPSLQRILDERKEKIPLIDFHAENIDDDDVVSQLENFHNGPSAPTQEHIYGEIQNIDDGFETLSSMKPIIRARSRRTPPLPPIKVEEMIEEKDETDIVAENFVFLEDNEKNESEVSKNESEIIQEPPEPLIYGNSSEPLIYGNDTDLAKPIILEEANIIENPLESKSTTTISSVDRLAIEKQNKRISLHQKKSTDGNSTINSLSSSVLGAAFAYHTTKKRNRPAFVKNDSIFNDPNAKEILSTPQKQVSTLKKISPDELETGVKIGEGQFGSVNKGHYKSIEVALKFFKSNDLGTLKEIEDEANFMADMSHKNVLHCIGISFVDGQLCLVTPLMQNGDLKKWVEKNNYSIKQALNFSLEIARGMNFLVAKNIIHGDLACRNIMLDEMMNLKIADFGLSHATKGGSVNDEEVYYQITNLTNIPIRWYPVDMLITCIDGRESKLVLSSSDMWSFGVVLHEIFGKGISPYLRKNNAWIAQRVIEGHRLGRLPDCPMAVYELMLRCWMKQHRNRPTFDDVIFALGGFILGAGGLGSMYWKDYKSCLNHGIRNPLDLDEERQNLEKTVMIYENDIFYERDKSVEKQIIKHYDCIYPSGMDLAWIHEKGNSDQENFTTTKYCLLEKAKKDSIKAEFSTDTSEISLNSYVQSENNFSTSGFRYTGTRPERILQATKRQDISHIETIFETYPDTNTEAHSLYTPHKFSKDFQNLKKVTALHIAVWTCNEKLTQILLDKGAYGNADSRGNTVVHIACITGNATILDILIRNNKPYKNVLNMDKKTPIELAVIYKNAGCVEVLLEKEQNADILYEIREKDTNRTLLHLACMVKECEKIVPILVKKAVDDENKIKEGRLLEKSGTNIFNAKRTKSNKKYDSRRGLNFLNLVDFEGNAAIHLATKFGFTNSVIYLRDQGANCGLLNESSELPILLAAVSGDHHAFWNLKEQTPTKLLQKDIQKIMIAAINANCDEIVENLADDFNNRNTLKKGSGTLIASRNNKLLKSPVIEAIRKNNLKVTRLLLEFGFIPPKDQLNSILTEIVQYGNASDFFDLLFENGNISRECKIGKDYLMKIVLNEENVIDRMNLVNVCIKYGAVCRASMLEGLINGKIKNENIDDAENPANFRIFTLTDKDQNYALNILNEILVGYDPNDILLSSVFKSSENFESATLFDFCLNAKNEDAALMINQYSLRQPNEKTARLCILNNLPRVLDEILNSGVSSDIKFPDGDTGLHKAIELKDSEILRVLQ